MRTATAFWRRSQVSASLSTVTAYRPNENQRIRAALTFALGLIVLATLITPLAASAQNLGTSPQFGQAVQGQQATTVEGTVLNIVNWSCNVIAPVIAVACLGIAGWHFKSGRGYMGWGVTGVSLMVISGLGRMAEGFITQAQGIQ
jgi:cytochrome bd-type quinol oxidase subunit 2